jgi:hypothetical protein
MHKDSLQHILRERHLYKVGNMGILDRLEYFLSKKHLMRKQMPLFGNYTNPNAEGPIKSTVSYSNTTPALTNNYTQGPNIEPYLGIAGYEDPFRLHSSYQHIQPEIAVREPWATSATYTNNVAPSTGTPKTPDVPKGAYVGHVKSLAPPMTRQRETLYDAGSFRNLQRFAFASTPSQRFFDEKAPLPEYTTPAIYTHAVTCNLYPMRQGWEQAEVPEPGMRFNEIGTSPQTLLSAPLKVTTIIRGGDGRRVNTPVKAPKRKKSGGS